MEDLRFPAVLPQEPTITSQNMDWSSIRLEHHCQPPGQNPEYCLDHYAITILLNRNSKCTRWVEGTQQETSILKYGSISVIPTQAPHWHRWENDLNILIFNISPKLLQQNYLELFNSTTININPKFNFHDPLILQLGLALWKELRCQSYNDKLYGDSMANAIVVHLLRNISTQKKKIAVYSGGLVPNKLKLVTDYINDNLEQNLSLGELASCAQLSQYHFSRAFKKSQGISPHQYVIQQRVEKAKQLIKENKMSTAEIAIACGFANQSHLHRHFKHMTGVTPRLFLTS